MSEIFDKHRRNTIETGCFVFTSCQESLLWIEPLTDYSYWSSPSYCSQSTHYHPKAMVKRHRNYYIIFTTVTTVFSNQKTIIHDVVVSQCCSFRQTCCPWSELNISNLLRAPFKRKKTRFRCLKKTRKINKPFNFLIRRIESNNGLEVREFIGVEIVRIVCLF